MYYNIVMAFNKLKNGGLIMKRVIGVFLSLFIFLLSTVTSTASGISLLNANDSEYVYNQRTRTSVSINEIDSLIDERTAALISNDTEL